MEQYPHEWEDRKEMPEARRSSEFSTGWRALVLAVGLAFAFLFLLYARLLPVYSDDGPGEPQATPDSAGIIWKYPGGDRSLRQSTGSAPGDLLVNGNMDQNFYWRYPNHYIPNAWFEWFSTKLRIPEFDDGHRLGICHSCPSSQRIHSWGTTYAGGLTQSAAVAPCTYYRFQAYGHSRPGSGEPPPVAVASRMKVGIEPNGWRSELTIPNYNPGLEPTDFPSTVVWSPEATHHYDWSPYEVDAEALAGTITVILHSYPEVNPESGVWWNDTLWDTGSLVEVTWQRATLLDSDHLPGPDGVITNLSANVLPYQATIEWDTVMDASSQVLYQVSAPSTPISPTVPLSNSIFMPRVFSIIDPNTLQHSPVDTTPMRHHQVVLTNLPKDYSIDYVALSRSYQGTSCVTSASAFTHAEAVSGAGPNNESTRLGGN